jgi:hypothetical protein
MDTVSFHDQAMDGGWNPEYRQKSEEKLRQYFHEEVLKREIASIETFFMSHE